MSYILWSKLYTFIRIQLLKCLFSFYCVILCFMKNVRAKIIGTPKDYFK